MKYPFYLALAVFVAMLLLPVQQVKAQTASDTTNVVVGDTMYVAWAKTGWIARTNALRNAIYGDTAANGSRANLNRVYKLKTNGFYWESDDITNTNFTLRIVGDPSDKIGINYPPIIQMTDTRDDGTVAALHILTAMDNIVLKNVWISGRSNGTGTQTSYQPMNFNGNNKTYLIDGCIFEQSNFSLVTFGGKNCDIQVVNCKFRNLVENPVTQQWTGRGISIWTDEKSVVIENNTFFNIGFATFQMEGGSAAYFRYNHNTIVNCGRGLMSASGDWFQSAYFANNLIINGWWEGEGYIDYAGSGRDSRQRNNGLINIAPLPAKYGPEQSRRIVITKAYAYIDPTILAKYKAPAGQDTIHRAYFVDDVTRLDELIPYALGGANDGHMFVKDTNWLSALPAGMTYYLTDVDWRKPKSTLTGATMLDSMWAMITRTRAGLTPFDQPFFYHPTAAFADQTWPLPENFTYTDASLKTAGTDGLPIGDLNWFPTAKATFLANQAVEVKKIEDMAGQTVIYTPLGRPEAEAGTVGGTAALQSVQGLTYYDYSGNGFIRWSFTAPTAGLYDTKWGVHMTNRGQSGPDLAINDTQFVDRAHGWGQFVFDPVLGPAIGLSNNAWVMVPIVADSMKLSSGGASTTSLFTFAAGQTKTIGVVGGGWGDVRFSEIDIVKHGNTDTTKLKAPDAVVDLVAPGAEGVIWVASGFKYVSLGTGGTIIWNFTAPSVGKYHLRTFYQNVGSAQSIQIKEGTTVLTTESFPGKADQTGLDNFSKGFTLTAGAHALAVSGANLNVDYVQLVKDSVVLSVNTDGMSPYTYSLQQNYPNPFNPATTINFSLAKVSAVRLTVFNILGQKVATLVNNALLQAGNHSVLFDAGRLATGAYFYRIEAGEFTSIKKMMLLK